jgi:hypothetical protein
MYGKVASGTVLGAVATGSIAPGRYRSRYRTALMSVSDKAAIWRLNKSPHTVYSFVNCHRLRRRLSMPGVRKLDIESNSMSCVFVGPFESAQPLKKALFAREYLDGHVGHIVYNLHLTGPNKLYQLQ